MNSLPKTVTQQHRGCDLNPNHTAPESNTLTTVLPSHPVVLVVLVNVMLFGVFFRSSSGEERG